MKIAFFGDMRYVGAREWIAFLAVREGIEAHAIVFPGDPTDLPSVRYHALGGPLPSGKFRYLACVPALRRALRRIGPDVLIAYRVVSFGFSASLTGFHPLVVAAQGQYIVSKETPSFFRHFARRAVRAADLIHSWAPPMTQGLIRLGAPPDRILTLTRGVDDERFRPGEEPAPPLTLLTMRQLEPYYNHDTLIDAVGLLRDRVPGVRYLIAGEGSARRDLEERAAALGLGESVRFLGAVPHRELPSLLRSAHLYVSSVPSDGTSASLLEAMAAGVTPIVSDNDANRFWIEDRTGGRLVPPFDARAYADAIEEAWRAGGWRRRAREINRQVIESRASWRRNMARFVDAYRDLAEGRSVRVEGAGAQGGGARQAVP